MPERERDLRCPFTSSHFRCCSPTQLRRPATRSSKHLTRALLRSTTALALITWLASSCSTADGSDSLGSNVARERFVQDETPELPLGPVFDKMPIPDSFPPFGWAGEAPATTLRVHSDGSVWVMRFGGVRTTTPVWAVFDSTGKFRGNVAGPYEMDVLDSSGERVLVLTRSDFGEEFVDVREVHW